MAIGDTRTIVVTPPDPERDGNDVYRAVPIPAPAEPEQQPTRAPTPAAVASEPPAAYRRQETVFTVAWFAKIGPTIEDEPETVWYWSGTGRLTLNVGDGSQAYSGTTVNGTQLVDLRSIAETQGQRNRRASISINLPDVPGRAPFLAALVDPGPVPVVVRWAKTATAWETFSVIDRTFVGRLSRPSVAAGVYSIDIETLSGRDQFGDQRSVSFEVQRNAYPAGRDEAAMIDYPEDDSFAMLPILAAQGVKTRWPRDD